MRKTFWIGLGVLLACLGDAWAQPAAPEAGSRTVAEWRMSVQLLGDVYAAGFAHGAMAFQNIAAWCEVPRTVGELMAFLRYRAEPTATMHEALVQWFVEAKCNQKPNAHVLFGHRRGLTR